MKKLPPGEAERRRKERKRRYYLENRDRIAAYEKAKYLADPTRKREQARKWRADHPGPRPSHWIPEDPAVIAERNKRYQALNRERIRQYMIDTRDHRNAVRRARRKRNPDKLNEEYQRRRARLVGAANIEEIDRDYIYARDGGKCHICKRKVARDKLNLDHLVPLARGGDHTHANLRVAHKSCNSRMGAQRLPAQLLLVA